MAEVVESTERADTVEQVEGSPRAVEVPESAGSEEPSLIRGLMQRIGAFGGANRRAPTSRSSTSSVQGNDLQVVIDQVAAQHSEDSSSEGEKCGVCARSFRQRLRARCAGCSKRIHRDGCITYMTLTTKNACSYV